LSKADSRDSPEKPSASEQHRRFVETARALECDEDKERFEAKLGKIASAPVSTKRTTERKGKK
jgi:hypothetical protein